MNESSSEEGDVERLESLDVIEDKIKDILCRLMPSVEKVKLKVTTDDVKSIFSKGVELAIDDGVETEVLLKGHGLQRCVIFSLLQALILNEKKQLIDNSNEQEVSDNPIILAIEEPELYIHPQLGKLFYDVSVFFSEKDQVLCSTHSPRFIDVYKYESIAIITKSKTTGTQFINCDMSQFEGLADRKVFQGLTQLNTDVNELFFAKKVVVAEGPEDKIAIIETLKKLKKINHRTEEIDVTVVVAGGKQPIPFFARVLNAFKIDYAILHDLDISDEMTEDNRRAEQDRNDKIQLISEDRIVTFPDKLEITLGIEKGHLKDQYEALKYFENHDNINSSLEDIIKNILKILNI